MLRPGHSKPSPRCSQSPSVAGAAPLACSCHLLALPFLLCSFSSAAPWFDRLDFFCQACGTVHPRSLPAPSSHFISVSHLASFIRAPLPACTLRALTSPPPCFVRYRAPPVAPRLPIFSPSAWPCSSLLCKTPVQSTKEGIGLQRWRLCSAVTSGIASKHTTSRERKVSNEGRQWQTCIQLGGFRTNRVGLPTSGVSCLWKKLAGYVVGPA